MEWFSAGRARDSRATEIDTDLPEYRSRNQNLVAVSFLKYGRGFEGRGEVPIVLVSSLLLRSLPVVDPQCLAMVLTSTSLSSRQQYSYATFNPIRQHRDLFDGALAYNDYCGRATQSRHSRRMVPISPSQYVFA